MNPFLSFIIVNNEVLEEDSHFGMMKLQKTHAQHGM
ncbi:hypothetical protein C8N37_11234 [Sphingobacterium faecium]|nr:hypothetical protein C8N37_11234 [Sphingobacterium faecium]